MDSYHLLALVYYCDCLALGLLLILGICLGQQGGLGFIGRRGLHQAGLRPCDASWGIDLGLWCDLVMFASTLCQAASPWVPGVTSLSPFR